MTMNSTFYSVNFNFFPMIFISFHMLIFNVNVAA
jgi:hypothetical protein